MNNKYYSQFTLLVHPLISKGMMVMVFWSFCNSYLYSQDTTPPVIVSPAKDTSFVCGTSTNLIEKLTEWYTAAASTAATDNSGTVTIQANITLAEAINAFNISSDILCGNKQKVAVTFTAVDPSGNISNPTSASFFTTDNMGPTINTVPNVQYSCFEGIRDTLIQWIRNKAGYIASDICSNAVTWTTFQFAITANGMVIQTGGGSIANGPYPNIPDGICNWRLNINFFVKDECGNQTITPGTTTFTVIDDVAPVFINPPVDVTVSCDNVPPPANVMAVDYCDMSIIPVYTQTSTKSTNENTCGYYSYQLTRTWTATDTCGNVSMHTQQLLVTDIIAPTFDPNADVTISCLIYAENQDSIYISDVRDNCSFVTTSFMDTMISNGCTSLVKRTYTLTDICENTTNYTQNLHIAQDKDPIIVVPATNETFDCQSQENLDGLLTVWLSNRGGSSASAICGELEHFAALKGTYNLSEPSSYPGILPTSLPTQTCPSPLAGYLRYVEVDFVYFDTCGNASVTTAIFGVSDASAPVVSGCVDIITVETSASDCEATVIIPVPNAVDDCIESESPIIRKISAPITSDNPGNNESIVDPVLLRLGPFNPSLSLPLEDGVVNILLKNLDIDDVTEYFIIKDEDGTIVGQSPITTGQCSSISFDLVLDKTKIATWIQDGFIDLLFEPNIDAGGPILSINNICSNSAIEATISYEIDIINTIKKTYTIDTAAEVAFENLDSLEVSFTAGEHIVVFSFEDCAGNISRCETMVNVRDLTPPEVICPTDITLILANNKCTDTLALDINFLVTENCAGNRPYNQTIPITKEASFISYALNEPTASYLARNKQMIFTNVFPITHTSLPVVLDVDFFGDNNDEGEYFDLFGPGGYLIGRTATTISNSGCSLSKTSLEVPINVFNTWIVSGSVTINAIPNVATTIEGGGINPCNVLTASQTVDNESYLQITLKYSDVAFTISSSGATVITDMVVDPNALSVDLVLNGGKNNMSIKTSDASGNIGQCNFEIDVVDNQAPVARCKSTVISLDPSGLNPVVLDPMLIDNGSTDNCAISKRTVRPAIFTCDMAGSDINVSLIVEDNQGNLDSCTAVVKVKVADLVPTFSAGLCSNDTLKLFANVPPSSVADTYTFHWKGPGTIDFFTENPFIPNADESFNGSYILTVTGFNGCTSVGSLVVNIQPLTNPALTTESTTICEGDDLILTATNYSGDIEYEWYEGIFPTGILLKTTQSPEFVSTPSIGVHFYYIIAQGPDCKSNSSSLLKVTVLKNPEAAVNNLLLSPCEGDQIVLGTPVFNANFTYFWTGPSGYNEVGQNPRVIMNANDSHAGIYKLVIKNGICLSDTATTTVVIFDKPAQPLITAADIFCQGATFNLIATNSPNADTYQWFLNGNLFTTTGDNNLIIPNAQSALEGIWTVKSVRGSCSSDASTGKLISIDNLLEIGATNSGPVCVGDSITLTATFVPNATYIWDGPIPNIPSISNPRVLGVPGDYTVTISTPTLCQNNASTTVKVINVAEITALSNDAQPCMSPDDIIQFFPSIFPVNGNYTYQWTATNSFTSDIKNPTISNISEADTGTYTLVVLNDGCPSKPVTTNVTFQVQPHQPIVEAAPFFCAGDSLILVVTNAIDGASYIWTTPMGQTILDTPIFVKPNASTPLAGNYSVEIEKNGCTSLKSDTFSVEIRTKPQTPSITSNSPVCYGDTIRLATGFILNGSYQWTGPTFVSDTQNPQIFPVTTDNSGLYSLVITQNGCESIPSSAVEVVVLEQIMTPSFTTNILSTCQNSTNGIELCLDPNTLQPDATYTFYLAPSNKLIGEGTGLCTIINDLSVFSLGSNFIYAVATIDGCSSTFSSMMIVNVNATPDITAQAMEDDIVVCPGESVQLISVFGPPLVSVQWSALNPSNIISNPEAVAPTISNLDRGQNTFYLDYSIDGCPDFSRDTIVVYVEFTPDAKDDTYTIEYNEASVFNILQNDVFPDARVITITNLPKYGMASIVGNTITYTPDPRFLETVTFTYTVCADICDDLCDEALVTIMFDDNIVCKAPTIFTPNSDGYNDQLVIPCLESGRFPDNKLVVFNEWGQEVYLGNPYLNDWEGTYGGNPVPVGTYFYILDTGDGQKPINGFLILQR